MMQKISTPKLSLLILMCISVLLTGCQGSRTTVTYSNGAQKLEVKYEHGSSTGNGGTPETNREIKENNDGKGAGDAKIDLSKSNVEFANDSPQISVTLTTFGTPVVTNIFPAIITNNILTFSNPATVDAWSEPYLDGTHGMIITSYITTEPVAGVNTVVAEIHFGDKLLDAVAVSTYIKGGTGIEPIEIF